MSISNQQAGRKRKRELGIKECEGSIMPALAASCMYSSIVKRSGHQLRRLSKMQTMESTSPFEAVD